ncbi:MAG TPA: MFS transporter, partial [Opitutales bacterium]|nr:MFS transporter [Opitutales bacterium]
EQLGWVLSAFGWSYFLVQIPGGWLVDRLRPQLLYTLICVLWSVATFAQGFASTMVFLFSLRLLLGIFEAPAYPCYNRVATTWFPDRERARAIAIYTSGQFLGPALLLPLLAQGQKLYGWSSIFYLTGTLGLVFGAFWYAFYRGPGESAKINSAELDSIREGGGLADFGSTKSSSAAPVTWADLGLVLSRRKLWGIYLGQFAVNSTMWFFITWFPTYLKNYRHFDFTQSPLLNSIPYLGAFVGVICSGLLSDWMVKRGVSATIARKVPIIAGLLLSTCIIGANFVESHTLIMVFLTLAFFGNGVSSIAWVMVSALAPKRLVGLTSGVFNFFGNFASAAVPVVIGYLVTKDNFQPGLIFISTVTFLGALSYIFLVGKVERVE